MLTTRGWWFLLTALLVLTLGVLAGLKPLVPVGLTLILWLGGVGALFYLQSRVLVRRLRLKRTLHDDRGPVDVLWAGRSIEVQVELTLDGFFRLPHGVVTDRLPFTAEFGSGSLEASGPVTARDAIRLGYRIRPRAPGRVRFEGVGLRLADLQGFFYHETFLPGVREYPVLPVLTDTRGQPATTKRHNLLPPPGIHRLRRAGAGSELLDLRDYLPGDPPRTIAWKVSARRDRLITKEFESEVPLRCTLFVDTSNSVRLGGPGNNPLTRLIEIASAAAQANTGVRDLTGLCLFDEERVTLVRPARTAQHLMHLLKLLATAADRAPTTRQAPVETLLPLAYAFADDVYPYLLSPDINRMPFWLPWLAPKPAWTMSRPTFADRLYGWFPSWVVFLSIGGIAVTVGLIVLAVSIFSRELHQTFLFLLIAMLLGWFALLLLLRKMPVFLPRHRRRATWRKRLAAVLSVRHGLAPGGLGALMEDDELMVVHLQRFLAEHQVPYALPMYDAQGRYLFASPAKVEVLGRALLDAVGKGHDNELFVLLADLFELSDRIDPLVRSVRVALARHHQVIVVCSWPRGVPVPDPMGGAPSSPLPEPLDQPNWQERTLTRLTTLRFHHAFHELRNRFGRLGVPVVCAACDESIPLILNRLERLRLVGRKR